MEAFRGIKIRDIFLDNQSWWSFFTLNYNLIRDSIIVNVCKLLACGTSTLGFHQYRCSNCNTTKKCFIPVNHVFVLPVAKKLLNNGSSKT